MIQNCIIKGFNGIKHLLFYKENPILCILKRYHYNKNCIILIINLINEEKMKNFCFINKSSIYFAKFMY